ncbi:DUF4407 domain-containing protein [soil metagenome]
MNRIRNFFWFCSGAHPNILKRCPTESAKYLGIGGTVLFTGILAALSSSYALYTVFDNIWNAVGFGILWGAMIFNLDRFIVSSMRKRNNFWAEFKIAFPRIVMAVLLAIVISKPLELKIFEKEINRKIDERKSEEVIKAKKTINQGFPELIELENKIAALKVEINTKEKFRDQQQTAYDAERFGKKTSGTTGIVGIGTNAKKKEIQLDEAQRDLQQVNAHNQVKIDRYEKDILDLYDSREKAFLLQKPTIDKYDGMAARIEALSKLSAESSAMNLASIFIVLLFIAIEIAPVFVKLISEKGPYDELLEQHENTIEIYANEKMYKSKIKTAERRQIYADNSKNDLDVTITVNQQLSRNKIEAETDIRSTRLKHRVEEEKEKLRKNKVEQVV